MTRAARGHRMLRCVYMLLLVITPFASVMSQNGAGVPPAKTQDFTIFYYWEYSYPRYASHLLSLGDVNRDGLPDLLANAHAPGGDGYRMHTYVYFGKRPGYFDMQNVLKLHGLETMVAGDVTRDGRADLVVQSSLREVSIYAGCDTCPFILDTARAFILKDTSYAPYCCDFGKYIDIGDLNGDGFNDIAVVDLDRFGPDFWGKVNVYFGRIEENRLKADIEALVYQGQDNKFGGAGVRIADVHGDGYKDLILGSRSGEKSGPPEPYQYIDVYAGGPGFRIDPEHPTQRFGHEIVPNRTHDGVMKMMNILDLNNDGIADLFVGDVIGYIFNGSAAGLHTTPDRTILNPESHLEMDNFIHNIGDINDDTYDDYLVNATGQFIGVYHVHPGCSLGIESKSVGRVEIPNTGINFGWGAGSTANVGDVTGDGVNDFVISYCDQGGANGFALYAGKRSWIRTGVPAVPWAAPEVEVFPNPFARNATVRVAADPGEPVQIFLSDVYGRIQSGRIRTMGATDAGTIHAMLGGEDLPRGIYYLIVQRGAAMHTRTIVKH